MRIAMVSPLEMRVPPVGYGGTELVVSLLTEELVRQGHDVTLFASGDSKTSGRLQSVYPRFLRGTDADRNILNMINVATCLEQASDFDIIHNHTGFEGMATAGLVETPMLTTLHGHLHGDWLRLFQYYKGWYNAISKSSLAQLPKKPGSVGVIYNAIDVASYPFNDGPRDPHLLFLSRISREKGPHLAIQVARMLNRRLIIAGNIHPSDMPFFKEEVWPEVDGDQIQYVGEADAQRKRELLAEAYCLLAPLTWEEPFGLFMIEANACGTPVIAFKRGAAPEVLQHGTTGFLVDSVADMAAAVQDVGRIKPQACRQHVEDHFDVPHMVNGYLAAYERILAAAHPVVPWRLFGNATPDDPARVAGA